MYEIRLSEPSFPAQADQLLWETAVGGLLREQFPAGEHEAP